MDNDFFQMMTPFDQYTTTQSLQMTKLLIPFLPPQSQRMLAIYVKFSEFQHTLSGFRNMRQQNAAPEDMFEHMRPFLTPADLESFDQMQNMMSMMSMFQEMQTQKEGEDDVGLDE